MFDSGHLTVPGAGRSSRERDCHVRCGEPRRPGRRRAGLLRSGHSGRHRHRFRRPESIQRRHRRSRTPTSPSAAPSSRSTRRLARTRSGPRCSISRSEHGDRRRDQEVRRRTPGIGQHGGREQPRPVRVRGRSRSDDYHLSGSRLLRDRAGRVRGADALRSAADHTAWLRAAGDARSGRRGRQQHYDLGNGHFAVDPPHYLGATIVTQKDRPVRIKFYNLLPTGDGGDLFIPVDSTVMGSGLTAAGQMGDGERELDRPTETAL